MIINQSQRIGLLPAFVYDKNRNAQLEAMIAFYKPQNKVLSIGPKVKLDPVDCYIPLPDLTALTHLLTCLHKENMEENIKRCFLFFFKSIKYVDEGSFFRLTYNNEDFVVQSNIVRSFFYWQVYNDICEAVNVEKDDAEGSVRAATLIPARSSAKDGQLKILVDAMLTVDAVECKDNLKILIVGSAHEPVVNTRSAYEPLFYMVTNSVFDLYDFKEEEGVWKIGTNTINRHRKAYNYTDMFKYDVYIDDAWFQGKTAFDSRLYSEGARNLPPSFSIKSFEEVVMRNIYYQVSKTSSSECRLVSRSVIPSYRENLRLGRCPFCVELKFFLRNDYSDEVYKQVLRQHRKTGCVPLQWYTELNSDFGKLTHIIPKWRMLDAARFVRNGNTIISVVGEKFPLRCLPHDKIKGMDVVEMRDDYLLKVAVVIDDDRYLVRQLMKCPSIYYVTVDGLYIYDKSKTVPTREIREHIQITAQNLRTEIQLQKKSQKNTKVNQILREASSGPNIDEHLSVQAINIERAVNQKLQYRKKVYDQHTQTDSKYDPI